MAPTTRRALTMADLAKKAGVSAITVSRALADSPLVNDETAARIKALAQRLGYTFNANARNLKLGSNLTVAVIVEMEPSPDRPMSDPYPLNLLGGILQVLTPAGYCAVLATLQGHQIPAVRGAGAVILLGAGVRAEAINRIAQWNMPMVVWGAQSRRGGHVTVASDNRRSGALAARRFVELGRRRAVFLGDGAHAEVSARSRGFSAALAEHGIEAIEVGTSGFTATAGHAAMQEAIASHPDIDAVFAASDLLAVGAMQAMTEQGRRVPQDVSIIGHDDTPMGAAHVPALTSIHQDLHRCGELLAGKALDLIRGVRARSQTLPTRLVIRAT